MKIFIDKANVSQIKETAGPGAIEQLINYSFTEISVQKFRKTEIKYQKMLKKAIPVLIFLFLLIGSLAPSYAQEAAKSKDEEVNAALAVTEASLGADKEPAQEPLKPAQEPLPEAAPAAVGPAAVDEKPRSSGRAPALSAITINGDTIEYSPETNEASATGNVVIVYGGSTLTCDKLVINNATKEARAEGNAKLEDSKGIIVGDKILYNFQAKTGVIMDPAFRANPYFGSGRKAEKASGGEFIVTRGYVSTCGFDKPHYRIGSRRISVFPKNKIQTRDNIVYLGETPILYIPQYNHSLKDPFMHVQMAPGKSGEWGPYLLSAWRYNITDNLDGKIYLDYRKKLGLAEGMSVNYRTQVLGKGNFKFYYTNEKPENISSSTSEFQRYLLRWRHRWNVDKQTNVITELYKIHDERRKLVDPNRNMLKDYFYREYEKDDQPLSYILFHHNFQNSSMDLLFQKRVNPWYDQLEKLPEIKYSLPSAQIANTPLYFDSNSSLATFNKKATTSPESSYDVRMSRLDLMNKISLPARMSVFSVTPFVGDRETVYDKGLDGKSLPVRTVFYSGVDVSTKFYRALEVDSDFMGMEIKGLRHVITPVVGYAYNYEPTIDKRNLNQVDSIDAITRSNVINLELSNKLQTKRKGASVDLADFRVNTSYVFDPQDSDKSGSSFSDFLFHLKLLPYSWLRVEGDATYNRSVLESSDDYNQFTEVNYDIYFDLAKERSFGLGQRYLRNGGNELTGNLTWRLNPKWKLSTYQRYNITEGTGASKGWAEQQFTLSRDLHCWTVDASLNHKKSEGTSVFFTFRLKAFPEMEFGFDQSYSSPQSGSSSEGK